MKFFEHITVKIFAVVILALWLMPVFSAPPKLRTATFFKRQYISLYSIANMYRFRVTARGSRVYMTGRYHSFSFTPEKMAASFNGVQITLCHSLYQKNGVYYVSKMDYDTMLMPLINRHKMRKHYVKTVFLDPGHGGRDVGAEGRYYYEKSLTLRLASKVRSLLVKNGFRVIMSRRSDAFISLNDRVAAANKYKADIMVSIHFNSAANKKVYGLETYCMTPAGASSSNASKIDYKKYPGNNFDRNNFALAYLMQRAMLSYSKALDRGVKHARFLVIKEAQMPAVLVECGFLSNPTSEKIIGNDRYLNQIAKGIAHSIVNYRRVASEASLK